MGVAKQVTAAAVPAVPRALPTVTSAFVRQVLQRAIDGVGPLSAVAVLARDELAEHAGDRERALRSVLRTHVGYAGLQGFATNLGGVLAVAAIPANLAGLALVQTRLVAAVAHLRGYDLDDPRVRNAVLLCLLTEDGTRSLVRRGRIPAPPMTVATAPVHDPALDDVVAAEVASEMLKQIAGKRVVATVGRRVPVLGGVVGAGSDSWATRQVGRYAMKELLPRGSEG